jgi:hypothetical protein
MNKDCFSGRKKTVPVLLVCYPVNPVHPVKKERNGTALRQDEPDEQDYFKEQKRNQFPSRRSVPLIPSKRKGL